MDMSPLRGLWIVAAAVGATAVVVCIGIGVLIGHFL